MGRIIASAVWLMCAVGPAWAGSTTTGPAALAVAALVAENAPSVAAADKKIIATLFGGNANVSYPAGKKIAVGADKIVCKAGNVDVTLHSCDLTFGTKTVTITGRKAHELYATVAEIGVPPDGAMGTIYESLSQLTCTVDPNQIKQRAGDGANCNFGPG